MVMERLQTRVMMFLLFIVKTKSWPNSTHITYKLKQDLSVIIVLDWVWGIISVQETEVKPQK